jgi:EmrB/QacA subfamily drug resistance transporter
MIHAVRQPCDEGIIRSLPATGPSIGGRGAWVLLTTILGSSLAFIDGTVVNVALPVLQSALGATVSELQWIVEAYALVLAALTLVGGALGDRYGRRSVFVAGVAVFALASMWCGLAPDVGQLIAARVIQGLGAALLVPGSLAIIGATFGEGERGRAIGTWSGFTSITTALGPLLGGWLVEHVSWRAAFFINPPIAVLIIVLAFLHVPESKAENSGGSLDWRGALTATLGLGAIVYGLLESSNLGLTHPAVIIALAAGVAFLAMFILLEARGRAPMLPLNIFRSRNFSGANLLTLLLYAALGAAMFFLSFDLIQVQGYSPTEAGAAFLPFIAIMSVLSRWSGGLVDRYGPKVPLVVGPAIAGIGFAALALPGIGGSYWTTFFPPLVALGLGMAIAVAPLTTVVMGSVGVTYAGIASGINNSVSRVAGLLAIAVFGIVILGAFSSSLDQRLSALNTPPQIRQSLDSQRLKLAGAETPAGLDPATESQIKLAIGEAYQDGFRLVMLLSGTLAVASAASAWLMIGGRRRRGISVPSIAARSRRFPES